MQLTQIKETDTLLTCLVNSVELQDELERLNAHFKQAGENHAAL